MVQTDLNSTRGPKDTLEGAIPLRELALAEKGNYRPGFWQFENGHMDERRGLEVPW